MVLYKNICIYKEDFYSFRYIAAKKALISYDPIKYKHSLGRHFVKIYKSEIRDYCKKMSKKSAQVLNFSKSYSEHNYLINRIYDSKNIHDQIMTKDLVDKVLYMKGNSITSQEQKILRQKVQGYKSKEIGKTLCLSESKINFIYNKIIKKLKNNYKRIMELNS